MTSEMLGTQGVFGPDEFDVLLNDVLRTVANPEMPERVRVNVQTRVWVKEMRKPTSENPDVGHPALGKSPVVFAPEVFLAQMQLKRDARSTAVAMLLHAAAIALIFWMTAMHVQFAAPVKTTLVTDLATPPKMDLDQDRMGGGGGQRGLAPVSKGQLPKFAKVQITPPMAPPMEEPKIHMPEPTIEVQTNLKMANNNMPNLGDPNSPLLGNSLGNGRGTGIGSGSGSGIGPGIGGNLGGGLHHVGGGVSKPEVIYEVEPEFSEEARKAKFMGVVTVNLIVDQKGLPENVHILRGVGMGLDQKAVEAVKQYRFKPAMLGGKPVAVEVNVEVDFKIF
jgi:protein TonB